MRIEGGNEPEKWLRSRKRDLRLRSGDRSGMGPNSELLRRLRTRSWSRRVRVSGGNGPRRPNPWTTKRTTQPCAHFTPCHSQ